MLKHQSKLLAVADGNIVPLDQVPDEVFSGKMLGDGFAIEPSSGTIYSPADGKVENISGTKHAYSIRSNDGLDILIHIGVDTVNLGGEGFTPLVNEGDEVHAGDVIARADLSLIRGKGLAAVTPVLIANFDALDKYEAATGEVKGGRSAALTYTVK